MSKFLIFAGDCAKWYRVLHYGNGFGLFESLRFAL